jgi:hypothetical protein
MATNTTYNRQAPYIEGAQENYLDLLTKLIGQVPGSNGVPTLGEMGPQIADQNALTQAAQQAAATQAGLGQLTFGPQGQVTGIGQGTGAAGYQSYLDQANQYSGANAYQQFMSPYQKDVIDTTLAEYDIQAQMGAQGTAADAITAGAFGGGREGVQRAQYQSNSDRNRAATQAGLLQQGFTQSNQLANQAFGQQMNLASLQPSLAATNIQQLGAAGNQNLAYDQALLDAQQQQAQLAYNLPYQQLGQYGSGIASMMSGTPYITTATGGAGNVGPLSGALAAGLSAYGLGSIFGGK